MTAMICRTNGKGWCLDHDRPIEKCSATTRQELGFTLVTVTEHGDLVRTWVEPWGSSFTEEWLDKLADQQMWDYEKYGKTETFVRLPCGDLPLSALQVPDPESQTEGGLDDPDMGTIDGDRVASREEQHGRYLDCGPQAWDDR